MANILTRLATALFKRAAMVDNPTSSSFDVVNNRLSRYALYWAFFEGTQYESIQSFRSSFVEDNDLYPHIRSIYNPASRLGNFYAQHICGGYLDPYAGNGKIKPSALPIVDASPTTVKAISKFWETSRFDLVKDLIPMYGSVLGDAFVSLEPNPTNDGLVCDVIHPAQILKYSVDADGYCTEYKLARIIFDEDAGKDIEYTETALLTDRGVEYVTYRNNVAHSFYGFGERWIVDLPFIPIAQVAHINRNRTYGWAEMHQKRRALQEADDSASKLFDHIRKTVDPVWLMAGMRKPRTAKPTKADPVGDSKSRTSSSYLAIYTSKEAKPHALIADLDLEQAIASLGMLLSDLEDTYPELRMAKADAAGDVSGRALLIARQDAEDKVITRRIGYDAMFKRLNTMAMYLGHRFNYDGYDGRVNYLDSDATKHFIAHRPVFKPHASERLEHDKAFWVNASLARKAGVPLAIYLRNAGWQQESIDEIVTSAEYAQTFIDVSQDDLPEDDPTNIDPTTRIADPNVPTIDFS